MTSSQCDTIFKSMCSVLPGGVNSPVRSFSQVGGRPMIVKRGFGDTIWDVDGRSYIDFCLSWGPLICGHAHPVVQEAVLKQISLGTTFGISSAIEGELALAIAGRIPGLEKIRFVSSGTEAAMSVIRLARAATGRNRFVKFTGHYHGHCDSLLVKAGSGLWKEGHATSSAGVPQTLIQETILLPFNDEESLRACFEMHGHEIAAVILEPVAGNMGVVPAKPSFMQLLRSLTHKSQALLIFDEVITGFRLSSIGALAIYPIDVDLFCYGKIIGGGFPAAAFGGRAKIMDLLSPLGPVYQAGTLSGNPVAMQAGLATLKLTEERGFYENLEKKTAEFVAPFEEKVCVQRVGSMFSLFFGRDKVQSAEEGAQIDREKFSALFRYLFDRGIYIPPSPYEAWFLSSAHTDEHLEYAQGVIVEFLSQSA